MQYHKSDHGFSFVEVIVAITIMAIGLLPIMWFLSRSNVGTSKTRDEIYAQHYADELFDHVIASGFAACVPTGDTGREVPSLTLGDETISIDERFRRRLFIEELASLHNSEWPLQYRSITVEVSWVTDQQPQNFRQTGIIYAPR